MAGTRAGGLRARDSNLAKHGHDFYKKIGSKGGSISRGGGFAAGEEGRKRAQKWGKIGGKRGKRGTSS